MLSADRNRVKGLETAGKYCRNSPGLCRPRSRSEGGGQARRFTVLIEASESGRGLGRCQAEPPNKISDFNLPPIDLIQIVRPQPAPGAGRDVAGNRPNGFQPLSEALLL